MTPVQIDSVLMINIALLSMALLALRRYGNASTFTHFMLYASTLIIIHFYWYKAADITISAWATRFCFFAFGVFVFLALGALSTMRESYEESTMNQFFKIMRPRLSDILISIVLLLTFIVSNYFTIIVIG